MHELFQQILTTLKGVWRYRWPALIVAWVIAVVGWIAVYFTPNRFEASAKVYVDTDSILKPVLQGLAVTPNLEQQVAIMSRTLITRPNLEKVLRMADLDIKAKTSLEQEALIDSLAKRVELKSVGRDNLFTVAFADKEPETAKKVVQSLVNVFMESSLGKQRMRMDDARRFIDEQIKQYEEKLIAADNALKEFKQKNVGMMPGDGGDFYVRLTEMSGKLNQAKLELREMENARDAIKEQLAGEEPVIIGDMSGEPSEGEGLDGYSNPELDARIQSLEKNLDALRLKYTEQHPDIISTKRVIAELESQKEREASEAKTTREAKLEAQRRAAEQAGVEPGPKKPSANALLNQNPIFQQLKAAMADGEARVAAMRARVQEYENRFSELKAMVNQVPQVEADLKQLTRDYEVTKANYEKLLARRESVAISGEAESSSGGLEFKIVEPPRVPSFPSGPNRFMLISLVLLGALAAGLAFAFVMSQIRPTFVDRKTLRELTGLPLLGSVSMIWTPTQKRKALIPLVAYGATFLSLLFCYGLLMGFYVYQGRGGVI